MNDGHTEEHEDQQHLIPSPQTIPNSPHPPPKISISKGPSSTIPPKTKTSITILSLGSRHQPVSPDLTKEITA